MAHKITVTVDDETYARIEDEAKGQDRTVSAQARRILRLWQPGDEDRQLKIDDVPGVVRGPLPPDQFEPRPQPWAPWQRPSGVTWTGGGGIIPEPAEPEMPGQTDIDDVES